MKDGCGSVGGPPAREWGGGVDTIIASPEKEKEREKKKCNPVQCLCKNLRPEC